MSASIISTPIWETLKEASPSQGAFMHGFTYSAHPVGAAVAPHRIIATHATGAGVLTRALPFIPVNSFSPPLTITKAQIDTGNDRFAQALAVAETEIAERL